MRRSPLTGRAFRLLGAIAVGLLAVGVAVSLAATPGATSETVVTVQTAPGETLAFDPAEPTVAAPGPVVVELRNRSSLAHNLVFTRGVVGGTRTIVEPGTSDRIVVVPTEPGAYPFACTIHMGMGGTLIVLARGS